MKSVSINGIQYDGIGAASRALKIDHGSVTRKCKDTRFPNWFLLKEVYVCLHG